MTDIVVALITGGLSLLGVVVTNMISNNKMQNQIKVSQAVTDTKLENLTSEVRTHNSFATRIPILETKIEHIEKQLGIK